jgi:hypothetical protein
MKGSLFHSTLLDYQRVPQGMGSMDLTQLICLPQNPTMGRWDHCQDSWAEFPSDSQWDWTTALVRLGPWRILKAWTWVHDLRESVRTSGIPKKTSQNHRFQYLKRLKWSNFGWFGVELLFFGNTQIIRKNSRLATYRVLDVLYICRVI